jgi:hypothetical protein
MWLPSTLVYALALTVAAFVPFRWELVERLPRVGAYLAEDRTLEFAASVAVSLLGYLVVMHALWLIGGALDFVLETPALAGRAEAGPFGRWLATLQRGRQLGPVLLLVAAIAVAAVAVNAARGQPDGPQIVLAGVTLISAVYTRRPFSFAYDVAPRLVKAPVEFARWSQSKGALPTRRPLAPPRARVEPTPPEVLEGQVRTTFGDALAAEVATEDFLAEDEVDHLPGDEEETDDREETEEEQS